MTLETKCRHCGRPIALDAGECPGEIAGSLATIVICDRCWDRPRRPSFLERLVPATVRRKAREKQIGLKIVAFARMRAWILQVLPRKRGAS